ncbi:uncharacterized protein UBRO_03473 [Ustilago bromivora]|uniref:BHLH domain-containing protein n=1 Tax=Ustilago bromivora TaxID=307758 RepID=A0A1K0H5R4_9BASI|nr:uncharacterized protein UBRO_03473 [Ustilago bromivora]
MTATKRNESASSSPPPLEPSEDGEQLFNKDGSRRKSRVLRRKTDHSIIERRRREKINEKLVALQNIVPACRKECQDLIERKFVAPLRETEDDDARGSSASKKTAKRKREEEKLEKAKDEEENRALRALCECQAERRASITSDVELDEHYHNAHSNDVQQEAASQALSKIAFLMEDTKRPSLSSSSSEEETLLQEDLQRPAKRRLHWGSDDGREASIRSETCRLRCHAIPEDHVCRRERSLSLNEAQTIPRIGSEEQKTVSTLHGGQLSVTDSCNCHSFCRTRPSCCREEEQSSETSSDASESLPSPPPYPQGWQQASLIGQYALSGRPRLPPIANLGLPKQGSQIATLRHDTLASLYRRDVPRVTETATSRAFRHLSLYASHTSPTGLSTVKP